MAERKKYDPALVKVGELITEKRKALGDAYKSRESFISLRSDPLSITLHIHNIINKIINVCEFILPP